MKVTLKNAFVMGFDKAGKYSVTNLAVKYGKKSILRMSFLSNALTGDLDNLSIWVKDLETLIPCSMDDLPSQKVPVSELINRGMLTLDKEEDNKKAIEAKTWDW